MHQTITTNKTLWVNDLQFQSESLVLAGVYIEIMSCVVRTRYM